MRHAYVGTQFQHHLPSDPYLSHSLSIFEEDNLSHLKNGYSSLSNVDKKVLSPHKTLDIPPHMSVCKKTLEAHKTCALLSLKIILA